MSDNRKAPRLPDPDDSIWEMCGRLSDVHGVGNRASVQVFDDRSGRILDSSGVAVLHFGRKARHKTAAEAIRSLAPKEPTLEELEANLTKTQAEFDRLTDETNDAHTAWLAAVNAIGAARARVRSEKKAEPAGGES